MPKMKYSELPSFAFGIGFIGFLGNIFIGCGKGNTFSWKVCLFSLFFIVVGIILQKAYNKGDWP